MSKRKEELEWIGSDEEGWKFEDAVYMATVKYEKRRGWKVLAAIEDEPVLVFCHVDACFRAKKVAENAINAHRWQTQGAPAVEAVEGGLDLMTHNRPPGMGDNLIVTALHEFGRKYPHLNKQAQEYIKWCGEIAALLPKE
jgi:hypothetical protein